MFVFSYRKRLGGREMLLCKHLQGFIHTIFHCFFPLLNGVPKSTILRKTHSKSFDYNINSSYTFSYVSFKVGFESLVTHQGNIVPKLTTSLLQAPASSFFTNFGIVKGNKMSDGPSKG